MTSHLRAGNKTAQAQSGCLRRMAPSLLVPCARRAAHMGSRTAAPCVAGRPLLGQTAAMQCAHTRLGRGPQRPSMPTPSQVEKALRPLEDTFDPRPEPRAMHHASLGRPPSRGQPAPQPAGAPLRAVAGGGARRARERARSAAKRVLAAVGDVQEAVLVLVVFVHVGHERGCGRAARVNILIANRATCVRPPLCP